MDFDELPYEERMHTILYAQLLPNVINLGAKNFVDGEYVDQDGFVEMTAEQGLQMARQLQAHPEVTHLNLSFNRFKPDVISELAGPIAMMTGLQELNLGSTAILFYCCGNV
jgi:hypothetical protein